MSAMGVKRTRRDIRPASRGRLGSDDPAVSVSSSESSAADCTGGVGPRIDRGAADGRAGCLTRAREG